MTTALDIIKRSMRLAGVYSLGEEPSAEETTAGLTALNSMIETWANSSLLIYSQTLDAIPMVAGTSVYTLGPAGTFVTTRPMEVLNTSYVVYQTVSYPAPLMTLEEYNTIAFKAQTAEFPWQIWYEANYPAGTLTVYPTPSQASTLNLWSLKPLTGFTNLTDTVDLPPGYYDALCFNMAVVFGPEFDGSSIPPSVVQNAANFKRGLKRTNYRPLIMPLPSAVLPVNGWVNWRDGA
jgi:hypothetical protein